MPYKGSNAEKLHNMCMYDLLCRMQENTFELMYKLGNNPCIIAYITGEVQGGRCAEFMEGTEEKCSKCIASWLNERSE